MINLHENTLPRVLLDRASQDPEKAVLYFRKSSDSRFSSLTWRDVLRDVERTTLALLHCGVHTGDRVGILSENRPEWIIADWGILAARAVVVPIYPTSSPQDTQFILQNAGIEILFLSSADHWIRLKDALKSCLRIRKVILFDDIVSEQSQETSSFSAFLESGRVARMNNPAWFSETVQAARPDEVATLIYTSGTTGPPKGVMLTHQNFLENAAGAAERIHISTEDQSISFLPLSHVFERLAGYYFMLIHGAAITFAQNMQTVVDDMRVSRPTVACAVPRFYEKFHARVMEKVTQAPHFRRRIFKWALEVGAQKMKSRGSKPDAGLSLQLRLANLLVFKKIKDQLGGRMRFFISGGAPLPREIGEFFYALDILILEGYGLTETSPVITVNSTDDFCFGTVGKPLKNVEVRIADDGEILTRSPCVMKGYFENPDATAAVLREGWFYTGDIGHFTPEGNLKITDRKKDIIKTSGGKMISPQNIEAMILSDTLFLQIVVLGDKKNYLVALVVPNREEVEVYARSVQVLRACWEETLKEPLVRKWIDKRFREKTDKLASFEQIKYYALLPAEFSLALGEVTPTLKIRRSVIAAKYKAIIDQLYEAGSSASGKSIRNEN